MNGVNGCQWVSVGSWGQWVSMVSWDQWVSMGSLDSMGVNGVMVSMGVNGVMGSMGPWGQWVPLCAPWRRFRRHYLYQRRWVTLDSQCLRYFASDKVTLGGIWGRHVLIPQLPPPHLTPPMSPIVPYCPHRTFSPSASSASPPSPTWPPLGSRSLRWSHRAAILSSTPTATVRGEPTAP